MMLNMVNVPTKEPVSGKTVNNAGKNSLKTVADEKAANNKNFNDVLTNATNENVVADEVVAQPNEVLAAISAMMNPIIQLPPENAEAVPNMAETMDTDVPAQTDLFQVKLETSLGENPMVNQKETPLGELLSKLEDLPTGQKPQDLLMQQKMQNLTSGNPAQLVETVQSQPQIVEMALPEVLASLNKATADAKKTGASHENSVVGKEVDLSASATEKVIPLTIEHTQMTNQAKAELRNQNLQSSKAAEATKSDLNVLFTGNMAKQSTQPSLQKVEIPTVENATPVNHFMTLMNSRIDTNVVQQTNALNQPEQPTPEYDIQTQIIEKAKLIKTNEDTQMVIKLKPEHLGDLTLKVTVENGVVSASFHSENAQVRTMLESSLMQLKQELSNQGIKVDNVSVYAGLGDLMSNGQEGQYNQQQSSKFRNQKIDLADFEDEVDKVNAPLQNSADEGVDYRI